MTSRQHPNQVRWQVRVILSFPFSVNASSTSYGAGVWMSEFPGFHLTTPTSPTPCGKRITNLNEYLFFSFVCLFFLFNWMIFFYWRTFRLNKRILCHNEVNQVWKEIGGRHSADAFYFWRVPLRKPAPLTGHLQCHAIMTSLPFRSTEIKQTRYQHCVQPLRSHH